MAKELVLSHEMAADLQRTKERLQRELEEVTRRLDAMLVLLRPRSGSFLTNGGSEGAGEQLGVPQHDYSKFGVPTLASAIEHVLSDAGKPLSSADIRRILLAEKFPSPRVGDSTAMYNVLMKMRTRERVIKQDGKYRLGPKAKIAKTKS